MRRMYSKPQLLEAVESESKVNGIKVFEDIKDKDGHARFIEGNLATKTISGVNFTYSKWSLSGSHLMMVLAGNITNGTTLSGTPLCDVPLPQWILDKIYPVISSRVDYNNFLAYADNLSTQNISCPLFKDSYGLHIAGTIAANTDKTFRIAFDLLIDDE